jgi:hypothetical protein
MKVTISMDESVFKIFKKYSKKNNKTLSSALREALLEKINLGEKNE